MTRQSHTVLIKQRVCLLLAAAMSLFGSRAFGSTREASGTDFREDFADLTRWRAWEFDKVDRPTRYDVHEEDGNFYLRMEADRSASGLILTTNFPVEEDIRLRWRWRADRLPDAADPLRREGDDYAVRIYVLFEQRPSNAGWLERWTLRHAPFRDQGVLPERSVAYALTSVAGLPESYPNPYTDRVVVFPVRMGDGTAGEWREIEVRPVSDYRRAFGKEPPPRYRLAVMSDSDDSQSRALAWLDFIEISVRPAP